MFQATVRNKAYQNEFPKTKAIQLYQNYPC